MSFSAKTVAPFFMILLIVLGLGNVWIAHGLDGYAARFLQGVTVTVMVFVCLGMGIGIGIGIGLDSKGRSSAGGAGADWLPSRDGVNEDNS